MNTVSVIGSVASDIRNYSYDSNEEFYIFDIATKRDSEVVDIISVVVSELLVNDLNLNIGSRVSVLGEIRIRHFEKHKKVYVFADSISQTEKPDECLATIEGIVNSDTLPRLTPLGKTIFDFSLRVNRKNRIDFIPCIAWNRYALLLNTKKGNLVKLQGRLQSRQYVKNKEIYSLNEFSVFKIEV